MQSLFYDFCPLQRAGKIVESEQHQEDEQILEQLLTLANLH